MLTPPEKVAARFHEDAGYLSSTLRSEDSGVDGTVIWFFAAEPSHAEAQHGPRIQVALGDRLTLEGLATSVGVTITSPPRVLGTLPPDVVKQVVEFVDKNRDALFTYWQGEMATSDVMDLIERV
jgi:hypothetical protein